MYIPAKAVEDCAFPFVMAESEATMNDMRRAGHHTICQTLREIYHATQDPAVQEKCRLAVAMAKAMTERLHYYKNKYEPQR